MSGTWISTIWMPTVTGGLTMKGIEYICRECLIEKFTITTPTKTIILDMRYLFVKGERR